jgi:uracil-DNA glycosylase
MLSSNEIEYKIFNCPLRMEAECNQRLDCNPIPGAGPSHPKFLVVGLNPGLRRGIWRQYNSLDKLKRKYLQECLDPYHVYGKFLRQLEDAIPEFRIPRTVYLTDIVKCPTIRNTNPPEAMLNKCFLAYWQDLVGTTDPDFIIGLGKMPSKVIGGFNRTGNTIHSIKILVGNKEYWFISAPHPSYKPTSDLRANANNIEAVIRSPENYPAPDIIISPKDDISLRKAEIENHLLDLDYQKLNRRISKRKEVVNIAVSTEFGVRTRIYWKERWKDDFAVIYDYKIVNGPTCVVPIKALFETNYVKHKRSNYGKSKDWWSGTYPIYHELTKLILSYQNKWDLIE